MKVNDSLEPQKDWSPHVFKLNSLYNGASCLLRPTCVHRCRRPPPPSVTVGAVGRIPTPAKACIRRDAQKC
eukprot:492850-Amphidinium_carterae.1